MMKTENVKRNKILLLVFLGVITNIFGQKDTLYYNSRWHKTTVDNAVFYRPLPLQKKGELYLVKDYHTNGNLQMEGYYSNVDSETLEGKTRWFYPSGQVSEVCHYNSGVRNGEALYYSENGLLRAKGIYKGDEYWTGTFIDNCCFNGYIPEYKEGKKVGQRMFYANSKQIAVEMSFKKDTTVTNYYTKKGETLGKLVSVNQLPKVGMQVSFYTNSESDVLGIEQYWTYRNGKMNGESAAYTDEGKQLAKGIYKNEEPFSGTIMSYNIVRTYVNGQKEGPEIGYTDKMTQISKGVNKENQRWQGQFVELYEGKLSKYVGGELSGEQLEYYKDDFEKIKGSYYVLNDKKEGQSIHYDEEGKILAKGMYKENLPWDGTFLEESNTLFLSYKQGKKHGKFITYDYKGDIIDQLEYKNDKLTGKVISKGYFQNKTCECFYEKGQPIHGEVCEKLVVSQYKDGLLMKQENFEYDYDKGEEVLNNAVSYDSKGNILAKTIVYEGESYLLTFRDGEPYNGVKHSPYSKESITYKKGNKEGPFMHVKEDNNALVIRGDYKNNVWHGIILFDDVSLDKHTECMYKKGEPNYGTVIDDQTFTTYKNGFKQGVEETIQNYGGKNIIIKSTVYKKGIRLQETWPQQKNDKGEIVKGFFKDGQPFKGYFFDFKSATASLSYYKNGIITGNQYIGYNDNESLVVLDSMRYKSGKPHQGKLLEHFDDKLHEHQYTNGKLIKTLVTDDYNRDRIEYIVTYTNNGFVLTDKDSDQVLCNLIYTDKERTKGRVEFAPDYDEFNGYLEFKGNKITAIDILFQDSATTAITYGLVGEALEITVKFNGMVIKAYPNMEHITEFNYKNFLDPEKLFMEDMVVIHTYIDGKKVAAGHRKDGDMYDGIHLWANRSKLYTYYKFNKGKRIEYEKDLSKTELLKFLKE